MCELTKMIDKMVDPSDPSYKTQKLISLLAQATDMKMGHLEKNLLNGLNTTTRLLEEIKENNDVALERINSSRDKSMQDILNINKHHYDSMKQFLDDTIEQLSKKIDKHDVTCPHGADKKIREVEGQLKKINFIFFFTQYPKLFILLIIGVLSLMGLGIDKVIDLVKALP